MSRLTEDEKRKRGWYYVGHDKYYWRNCDNCGMEYRGMGSSFCSRKCSANLTLRNEEDGTVSIVLKNRPSGTNHPNKKPENAKKISDGKRGQPNIKLRGEKHPNWKGGESNRKRYEREKLMCMKDYIDWRTNIFKRDGYKCVLCGIGGVLQVHHIYNWCEYPELRYESGNGVTVCSNCHPRGRLNESKMVDIFNKIVKEKLI